MDVREKLVELLNGIIDGGFKWHSYSYESGEQLNNDEIASHLIAHGVTVQEDCNDCAEATQNCIVKLQEQIAELRSAHEWISVDDRMPTQEDAPTEYVFTAYKNQNCYDVEIALWDTVIAYPDMYDYWMALPLPQPPKGE